MNYTHVTHESIPPFINKESRILILGSLPSIASRRDGFFYAHKQNRFFKVLAAVFNEKEPKSTEERKEFLKRNNVALYDVIYECEIVGSSDSSIKNVIPIELETILNEYPNIKAIFTTGSKAKDLFGKYLKDSCNLEVIALPSTSGANARMSFDALLDSYKEILKFY